MIIYAADTVIMGETGVMVLAGLVLGVLITGAVACLASRLSGVSDRKSQANQKENP